MEGADVGAVEMRGQSYKVTVGDLSAVCSGGRVDASHPGSVCDVKGLLGARGVAGEAVESEVER